VFASHLRATSVKGLLGHLFIRNVYFNGYQRKRSLEKEIIKIPFPISTCLTLLRVTSDSSACTLSKLRTFHLQYFPVLIIRHIPWVHWERGWQLPALLLWNPPVLAQLENESSHCELAALSLRATECSNCNTVSTGAHIRSFSIHIRHQLLGKGERWLIIWGQIWKYSSMVTGYLVWFWLASQWVLSVVQVSLLLDT